MHFGVVSPMTFPEFASGCAPACTVLTCSCTAPGPHWTSTTELNGLSWAWFVDFGSGSTYSIFKFMATNKVRAVRGGA